MKIGLLLYPDVEPIDLATIGVISMAKRVIPDLAYVTLSAGTAPVRLANGLRVLTDYDLSTEQSTDQGFALDLLIVPGGPGWQDASTNTVFLDFIKRTGERCPVVSVCTGAMIIAAAGLLNERTATTKVQTIGSEESPLALLAAQNPSTVARHALVVDEGRVITGGGVSLCIDAMLYVIEQRYGAQQADEVARIMEYGAARAANLARLDIIDNRPSQ